MLALAQPWALSTPLPATQMPLTLWVNGNDISAFVDPMGYQLNDIGFGTPQQLTVRVIDSKNTVAPLLTSQAWVTWIDQVNDRVLYQGFIKDVVLADQATYSIITFICNDLSEALDFARPIIAVDAGTISRNDQAQVQSLVGNYSLLRFDTAYVQKFNAAMPASNQLQMSTLRGGIESTLSLAGVANLTYYVDALGRFHTITTGDTVAPFTISD